MTPSINLPQEAQDRLKLNENISYVVLHLPKDVKKPKPEFACINCAHATWFATEKSLKGYCSVLNTYTHTDKDPGTIVICDKNIPKVEGTAQADEAPENETTATPKSEMDDPLVTDLLDM